MQIEYLKTLWRLRFEKMAETESQAAWVYQDILDQCLVAFGEKDELIEMLRTLVHDERNHHKMAEELLEICRRTHPEYH